MSAPGEGFSVFFGREGEEVDVTAAACAKYRRGGRLVFPPGDEARARGLGQPWAPGDAQTWIRVVRSEPPPAKERAEIYPSGATAVVALPGFSLKARGAPRAGITNLRALESAMTSAAIRLRWIHDSLVFKGGSLSEEYPEQLLAAEHLGRDDVVLELGSNIGRNSVVIARLLADSANLVTLETMAENFRVLCENRDENDLDFVAVNAALSRRRLEQAGWDSRVMAGAAPARGWREIPTISWTELQVRYPRAYTALVADCEGALLQILRDEPGFLAGFRKILVENDYKTLADKREQDAFFRAAGFAPVVTIAGGFGPCMPEFYQVWTLQAPAA